MKNSISILSKELRAKIKDYGVTFVGLDQMGELHTVSEYDLDPSFYEAMEKELLAFGSSEKFEEGKNYVMKFITDSDLKVVYKCIARTAKMATLKAVNGSEVLKRKINEYNGVEYITAGSYSMAPVIRAK